MKQTKIKKEKQFYLSGNEGITYLLKWNGELWVRSWIGKTLECKSSGKECHCKNTHGQDENCILHEPEIYQDEIEYVND